MEINSADLLKSYHSLPEFHKSVLNVFVVKYSGVPKYDVLKYIQDKTGNKATQKEYQSVLNALVDKQLVALSVTSYDIPFNLKVALFPKLIKDERYSNLLWKIQKEHNPFGHIPVTEYIRDFLFGYYAGESRFSKDATNRLISKAIEAAPLISEMLLNPEYDHAFLQSPVLLYELLDAVQLLNVFRIFLLFPDSLIGMRPLKDCLIRFPYKKRRFFFSLGTLTKLTN